MMMADKGGGNSNGNGPSVRRWKLGDPNRDNRFTLV